jgi:lambda family phage portal protein
VSLRSRLAARLARAALWLGNGGQPVALNPYEAASGGHRFRGWHAPDVGPTTAITTSVDELRTRSHMTLRNDPVADNGVETWVDHCIGSGVRPKSLAPDEGFRRELAKWWPYFVEHADARRQTDLYGCQALALRSIIECGEVLAIKRQRFLTDGLPVPVQLQWLEAAHLPSGYTRLTDGGQRIVNGIQYDALDVATVYHLHRRHPGEQLFFGDAVGFTDLAPVPASRVIHAFNPRRVGQNRGEPWLARVLIPLHEMLRYMDAEAVRKKGAAMIGGWIKKNPSDQPYFGEKVPTDKQDTYSDPQEVVERYLEPGTWQVLNVGEEAQASAPADVGPNFDAFVVQQLHRIAVGLNGLPHALLTGDLRQVNFSQGRMGLLVFKRRCQRVLRNLVVHQICRPTWEAFVEGLFLAGRVQIPRDYAERRFEWLRCTWMGNRWEFIRPQEETAAIEAQIRDGLNARSLVVPELLGIDSEELDDLIAEDNARADQKGLVFDTDPRRVAKQGTAHTTPPTADDDEGDTRGEAAG